MVYCVSVLLVKIMFFHRIRGKHPTDPPMGDCGVARFIRVAAPGFPMSISVRLTMGKIQSCLHQGQTKVSVQSFCFMISVSCLEPTRSALDPRQLPDPPGNTCSWVRKSVLKNGVNPHTHSRISLIFSEHNHD